MTSSQTPCLVPVDPPDEIKSIIAVGDKPHTAVPYRMVGISDGLGAFDNADDRELDKNPEKGIAYGSGTFTLRVNHELVSAGGIRWRTKRGRAKETQQPGSGLTANIRFAARRRLAGFRSDREIADELESWPA